MEGFAVGLIASGVILGLILKAVGKHEETTRAVKDGGLSLLLWWLRR